MLRLGLKWALALTISASAAWAKPRDPEAPVSALIGTEMELRHNLHFLTYPLVAGQMLGSILLALGLTAALPEATPDAEKILFFSSAIALQATNGMMPRPGQKYWFDVWITKRLIWKLAEQIQKSCPKCRFQETTTRSYAEPNWALKVIYPDGWWFQLAGDPLVVEITHHPFNVNQMPHLSRRIQRDIFDNGARIGLRPSRFANNLSGTHFNLGESTFFGSVLLARNFIVDFYNHPELAMGIWQKDYANAIPVTRTQEGRMQFAEQIAFFDWLPESEKTMTRLAETLTVAHRPAALSLSYAGSNMDPDKRRMEIRASRGVESAEHLQIMSEIIEARLRFLSRQERPIAVLFHGPALSPLEKLRRYKLFIEETGYPWERASRILPISYRLLNRPEVQACANWLKGPTN